ncbi:hypothetical protein IWX46DRAFT_593513, partial [Phyllosticta citricarpa]
SESMISGSYLPTYLPRWFGNGNGAVLFGNFWGEVSRRLWSSSRPLSSRGSRLQSLYLLYANTDFCGAEEGPSGRWLGLGKRSGLLSILVSFAVIVLLWQGLDNSVSFSTRQETVSKHLNLAQSHITQHLGRSVLPPSFRFTRILFFFFFFSSFFSRLRDTF